MADHPSSSSSAAAAAAAAAAGGGGGGGLSPSSAGAADVTPSPKAKRSSKSRRSSAFGESSRSSNSRRASKALDTSNTVGGGSGNGGGGGGGGGAESDDGVTSDASISGDSSCSSSDDELEMAPDEDNVMNVPLAELERHQSEFWSKISADNRGMLGDIESVHVPDVAGSLAFIESLIPHSAREKGCALDCGAGIGRVTKDVLVPSGFPAVDLMDVRPEFLQQAEQQIGRPPVRTLYCRGLAEFDFDIGSSSSSSSSSSSARWDLIWVQWCVIYLRDAEFVTFFKRAAAALSKTPHSYVVLKENVLRKDRKPVYDESDKSVTRSDEHLRKLFERAGVVVVKKTVQHGFPKDLFPVYMYALRPKD